MGMGPGAYDFASHIVLSNLRNCHMHPVDFYFLFRVSSLNPKRTVLIFRVKCLTTLSRSLYCLMSSIEMTF